MTSCDAQLARHIRDMVDIYHNRYVTDECHVFFAEDEDSTPFCEKSLEMLNSFISLDSEHIRESARRFALSNIESDTPYIILINIMKSFKHDLMSLLLKDASSQMALRFYTLSNAAENCISQTYLNFEIDTFIQYNRIRMESIHRLRDINTLRLYEEHLLWFDELVISLKHMDMSKLPELHPGKCAVGKWLNEDGSKVITDKLILDKFTRLHRNLHLVAKHIEFNFKTKPIDFNVLMLLLKKAELFSLSLGVELSIINNIRYQATASKDTLTGTLNRQLLFHIFSTQFELSRAIEKSFCLVMTDLDNFKLINDDYGHIEGDKVLSSFGTMITENLRDSDFVIRYGGEEFLLILPSTNLENALILAEKLRVLTHSLKEEHHLKRDVSCSCGVIEIIPQIHEVTDTELMLHYIQKVDKELYLAKEQGKDQVCSPNHHPG